MFYETINTHDALYLFRHLMQPQSEMRVLRLVGEAKMGKSHLLTKVLPRLAQQDYQARCVTLDVRNPLFGVPDILNMASTSLGKENCGGFFPAYQAWVKSSMERPKVEVHGVRALFSFFRISVKDNGHVTYPMSLDLTNQFVSDVNTLNDAPLLFLIDSVNNATERMQTWLMDVLLVQLLRCTQVRVILAGRSLPDAHGSYAALCGNYLLRPVTEIEEYIAYCKRLNSTLEEQSIRDFAHAFDYIPGTFSEYVLAKFVKQRLFRG
ncbi:MAG: hypothetical protein NVSMB38_44790 [Ktedonobacteraceae bacterium]